MYRPSTGGSRIYCVPLPGVKSAFLSFATLEAQTWELQYYLHQDGKITETNERSRVTSMADLDTYAEVAGLIKIFGP